MAPKIKMLLVMWWWDIIGDEKMYGCSFASTELSACCMWKAWNQNLSAIELLQMYYGFKRGCDFKMLA